MYVHCRIIYGGHKVNILQAVLYLHTMEYYSGIEKKKWTVRGYNTDEPRKH